MCCFGKFKSSSNSKNDCIRKVAIKPTLSCLGYSKIEKQNPMFREFLDHGVISPDEMYSRLYDIRFLNSRGLH